MATSTQTTAVEYSKTWWQCSTLFSSFQPSSHTVFHPSLHLLAHNSSTMATSNPTYGLFTFVEPDLSIPAKDRPMFAAPETKTSVEEKLVLHDFRTATDVVRGAEGLDAQGFTFINHTSALSTERLLNGTNIEDVEETYAQEALNLLIELTGAKRGVVHNVVFRRRLSPGEPDLSSLFPKGASDEAEAPRKRILGSSPHEAVFLIRAPSPVITY